MIALAAARAALAAFAARIPSWLIWIVMALTVVLLTYHLGRAHQKKLDAAAFTKYKNAQATQTEKIVQAETKVVIEHEIEYRDRVRTVYLQGEKIEKIIPDYVQPADDVRFAVNVGFLRVIDAAWAGVPIGPSEDSDREPAAVPLSDVAAVEVGNATSCRAWREQVIGWRSFYAAQQTAINGKVGTWYVPEIVEN